MSTEIAAVDSNALVVSEAKAAIKEGSLDVVTEIHDRAVAAEAYNKAKQNREAYMAAGEIKLWAERAAGAARRNLPRAAGWPPKFDREKARQLLSDGIAKSEVARQLNISVKAITYAENMGWSQPDMPLAEFDKQLGVTYTIGRDWEKISYIPEKKFAQLIEEAKVSDGSLTAKAMYRRSAHNYEERVEPGIYRLMDGRLVLKWTKNGVSRRMTLSHAQLDKARKDLAKLRGDIHESKQRGALGKTVSESYAFVRQALRTLDSISTKGLDKTAKDALANAVTHLHYAEDHLVIAARQPSRD